MNTEFSDVRDAIAQIERGGFVIVVDSEDRENEGDLIIAAQHANQANMAFMIRHTSGVICAPCEPGRLSRLELPPMVEDNQEPHRCCFTISTDYLPGMTTGISALERARTLNALADPGTGAADFIRPGHIFPLQYQPGGVLVRSGHTEAALDLCRLAGCRPAAALCELVNDDGTMQRVPDLLRFAAEHELPIISIDALIRYRANHEVLVEEVANTPIVLHDQTLDVHVYRTLFDDKTITAVVKGTIDGAQPTLVRVVKGDRDRDFLSSAVTPGNLISRSLEMISRAPQGVFIYIPAAGAYIPAAGAYIPAAGAYSPAAGADAAQNGIPHHHDDEALGAVWREVGLGSYVLNALGVRRIHLLASRELSFPGIASFGLTIETLIKEI